LLFEVVRALSDFRKGSPTPRIGAQYDFQDSDPRRKLTLLPSLAELATQVIAYLTLVRLGSAAWFATFHSTPTDATGYEIGDNYSMNNELRSSKRPFQSSRHFEQ